MGIPLSAAVTLGLLFFLSVGLNEQVAEGCKCIQKLPQQHYCDSDTVIRAKVIGKKVISASNGLTAYSVNVIETFKHVDKNPIRVIYSRQNSCGVRLNNEEYLLSGYVKDGKILVDLCELRMLWQDVSSVPVSKCP